MGHTQPQRVHLYISAESLCLPQNAQATFATMIRSLLVFLGVYEGASLHCRPHFALTRLRSSSTLTERHTTRGSRWSSQLWPVHIADLRFVHAEGSRSLDQRLKIFLFPSKVLQVAANNKDRKN